MPPNAKAVVRVVISSSLAHWPGQSHSASFSPFPVHGTAGSLRSVSVDSYEPIGTNQAKTATTSSKDRGEDILSWSFQDWRPAL